MATFNLLDYFLITQLSAGLLIFCRLAAAIMVMPAFGESYVSPSIRILLAIVISILLTPILMNRVPAMPASPLALFVMMTGEILVGIFIGMMARTILSAIHVAGNIIAFQSSLAIASIFDPITQAQSAAVSNMLTIIAMTIFFALNLHHLLLAALFQSYDVFAPGVFPSVMDMNILNTRLMADCFNLGVALAAPHIVFSLLFYAGGGLMTRLMPNFQVFFVLMSPQIMLAFFLLLAIMPIMMDVFANFMQTQLSNFVAGAS